MGRYRITIEGTGCHHNGERAEVVGDADLLTKEFVAELESKGHKISHASFDVGMYNPAKPEQHEFLSNSKETYRDWKDEKTN